MKPQPIETAPKDGTYVLVWAEACDNPCVAFWNGHRWCPCTDHVDAEGGWDGAIVVSQLRSDSVTHWCALPEPPSRERWEDVPLNLIGFLHEQIDAFRLAAKTLEVDTLRGQIDALLSQLADLQRKLEDIEMADLERGK